MRFHKYDFKGCELIGRWKLKSIENSFSLWIHLMKYCYISSLLGKIQLDVRWSHLMQLTVLMGNSLKTKVIRSI